MALPGPLVLGPGPFPQFNQGRHLMDGAAMNQMSAAIGSSDAAITAGAGGTRAAAYPIKAAMNNITVVANANDAVVLPVSYPGCQCYILNSDAADSLQIFANGSDTINATAGATGVALAAGAAALFQCIVAGNWRRFVSA